LTDQKASKVAALLDSGVSDVYLSAEIVRRLCLKPSGPLVKVMSSSDFASTVHLWKWCHPLIPPPLCLTVL